MPKWTIGIWLIMVSILFSPLPADTDAEKLATLDPILQPRSLHVHRDRAYITEKHTIHIVSLTSGEVSGRFGKRGEGPGEFKRAPVLRVLPDVLAVNSWGKILFCSHDGRYIKEMKHQFGRDVGAIPLGDNYVAQKTDFSEKEQHAVQSFGIYDGAFKLVKKIFSSPNPHEIDILPGNKKQPYPVINDNISLDVYDGRIYIADSRKGFYFQVFDGNGARLPDIALNLSPREVDEPFRKKMLSELEAAPWWGQLKDKLEPVFPEFFPEIRFFDVRDGNIYVQTFIINGDDCLFRVYDLKAKTMSTVYLPLACDGTVKRYDIQDGRYYFLRVNEDTDVWELFVKNI